MATVRMTGWREGLQKVALTKLQVELLHISLREAKSYVDQLLNDNAVELQVADDALAAAFVVEARKLGAECQPGPGPSSRLAA